jgi:hypothetical protein
VLSAGQSPLVEREKEVCMYTYTRPRLAYCPCRLISYPNTIHNSATPSPSSSSPLSSSSSSYVKRSYPRRSGTGCVCERVCVCGVRGATSRAAPAVLTAGGCVSACGCACVCGGGELTSSPAVARFSGGMSRHPRRCRCRRRVAPFFRRRASSPAACMYQSIKQESNNGAR